MSFRMIKSNSEEARPQKKRGLITSSTFRRYWGKPINLKRVIAHANRREPSTSFLIDFFQFPNCPKQESKRTLHPICLFYNYLSP